MDSLRHYDYSLRLQSHDPRLVVFISLYFDSQSGEIRIFCDSTKGDGLKNTLINMTLNRFQLSSGPLTSSEVPYHTDRFCPLMEPVSNDILTCETRVVSEIERVGERT